MIFLKKIMERKTQELGEEIMIFLVVFTLVILSIFTSFFLFRKLSSPLIYFTISWLILFFLSYLNLLEYEPFTDQAIFLILIGFVSFYIGTILAFFPSRFNLANKNHEVREINFKYFDKVIKSLIFMSFFAIIVWLFIAINNVGYLELFFSSDRYQLRTRLVPNIPRIISLMIYLPSLSGSLLISLFYVKTNHIKIYYFLLYFAPLVLSLILGQRAFMLITIITFLVPLLTLKSKQKKYSISRHKKLTPYKVIFLSVVFFIVVGLSRGNFTNFGNEGNLFYSILAKIYLYLTGSFRAFSIALDQTLSSQPDLGLNFLTPIAKLLYTIGFGNYDIAKITLIENGRNFVSIPYVYNVYTFAYDMIADFGILGYIFIMFLLGLLTHVMWIKILKKNKYSVYSIVYVFLLTLLLFGFSGSITSFSLIWYGYIFACFIMFITQKRIFLK